MTNLINRLRNPRITLITISILTLSFAAVFGVRRAYGVDQDRQKLNRFVQSKKADTPAMRTFREGRDQIESENWQQAAEKFNSFVQQYGQDQDIDAALYWYAYALKRMGKKDEAATPLQRLLGEYKTSTWRREAEAMLVELGYRDYVNKVLADDKSDNDNCEIKILALQSLFEANEERALAFVTDVLKSNSTDCPALKYAAVSLLGSHGGERSVPALLEIARSQGDLRLRLTAIKRLGEQKSDSVADELAKLFDADKTKEVRIQILRAFAETSSARGEAKLVEVARSGDDVLARQYAIRFLGEKHGDASLDELTRIYDADRTMEIRLQVIRALSERNDPRAHAKLLQIAKQGETPDLRIAAIRGLGNRRSSLEDLLELYKTETNDSIKSGLIRAYGDMNDPRALEKLKEIAMSKDKLELRQSAIRQLGDHHDEQTVDQLIGMYDGESDVHVKATLIRSFGEAKQKSAVQKLIAIARTDQSVELRKLAVRLLGESKDPDALKFLEDLLK